MGTGRDYMHLNEAEGGPSGGLGILAEPPVSSANIFRQIP